MEAYSSYKSATWYMIKKTRSKPKTADEYATNGFVLGCIKKAYDVAVAENDDFYIADIMLDMELTQSIKFCKVDHYFLDAGLADFMVSSVKDFNQNYFIPQAMPSTISHNSALSNRKQSDPFFIHFPSKERAESIGVIPYFKWHSAINKNSFNLSLFGARDSANVVTANMHHESELSHGADFDTMFVKKLVYGFTLYLDAFPDVIREADNIKHVGHYKGHRHSVRANDIVRTEAHHSVSPHFRRGHFRLLSSEKFKHKRGQTIFIKGMFVKGHAFDVLADSETAVQS